MGMEWPRHRLAHLSPPANDPRSETPDPPLKVQEPHRASQLRPTLRRRQMGPKVAVGEIDSARVVAVVSARVVAIATVGATSAQERGRPLSSRVC